MHRNDFILAVMTAALVCGCGKKESGQPYSSATSDSKVEKLDPDATMLGQIEIMVQADSAISSVMKTKSTRPEVREFAARTVGESHEIHAATEEAARKTGITPVLPPGDATPGELSLTMSLINGSTKNTNIDGIYLSGVTSRNIAIESEANYRKAVTKESRLKDFYEKARATSHARVAAVAALVKKQ